MTFVKKAECYIANLECTECISASKDLPGYTKRSDENSVARASPDSYMLLLKNAFSCYDELLRIV